MLAASATRSTAGDGEDYLMATIQETLRRRPVLPNIEPRLVKQPIEVGGWDYPAGVCLVANAYLLHHDPDIYPDPYAFRPERFLDEPPGTYTWIPFGGGRRRCLGASFAMLEMQIVLARRAARLRAAAGRAAATSRRGGATSPCGPGAAPPSALARREARVRSRRDRGGGRARSRSAAIAPPDPRWSAGSRTSIGAGGGLHRDRLPDPGLLRRLAARPARAREPAADRGRSCSVGGVVVTWLFGARP